MKKLFYFLAIALVAATACQQKQDPEPTPGPEPEPQATLTLLSDATVNIGADSETVTIKFTSSANWTAQAEGEYIVLKDKGGVAGENIELKATVQSLPEEENGRVGGVVIKSGELQIGVVIMQGNVFYIVPGELYVGVEGGKAEFQVISNLDYEVTTYESFDWAPVAFNKTSGEGFFTVAANAGYDLRYAYVKFTMSAIQDPVYNEETGEPTGETQDHVERIYVYQEGHSEATSVGLPADFDVTNSDDPIHDATASIAYFNGKLLVCDATKVYEVNSATGEFSPIAVPEDVPVQSITNDDAGNLIFAPLIEYLGVGKIYAVKATDTKMQNPQVIIPWVNEAWSGSRGADKVAARGNVFGNGVVTMIYGGVGSSGGLTYCLAWEIKDGSADIFDYNEWNKSTHRINGDAWLTTPDLGDDLWLSNRAVFAPAGPAVSDGFFYAGYDGLYTVYYYDGTAWTGIAELGNWAYAPNGMATIEWNGKKILACVNMAYFPEWSMPSELYIIDVTDPKNPAILSTGQFDGPHEVTGGQESATTDVVLRVEGNDLVADVVDSSWGVLLHAVYPKL
ncbi:MAG: hypothetical protein J6X99_06200 [Bacteroidales bacterium]|nr:hypothetical protein [Bacteroidales bacterium]